MSEQVYPWADNVTALTLMRPYR